jgi:phosphoribosylamine--glycine ligase
MGYRILVVGGGGREHALTSKLASACSVQAVIVSPGNAGTALLSRRLEPGKVVQHQSGAVTELARAEKVDLVVVGPEAPLVAGLVDQLEALGIAAFGPSRRAAQLEGSKAFMKDFAVRHGIRTARHVRLDDPAQVEAVISGFDVPPVVKADGLCAGKGVVVAATHAEAMASARAMLCGSVFGDASRTVVVEERLEGAEASVLALSDGERMLVLPPAQDHKRIGEGDTGPNTGGMGAYAPAPLITPALLERIRAEILEPTLSGMRAEGTPFRGTLYAGLMITPRGEPLLLEFNVRFGDPETQALLPLVTGDLGEALLGAATGRLDPSIVRTSGEHALCVVMAAAGYPGSPTMGDPIEGLRAAEAVPGVEVFHAGTRLDGERVLTAGGRVLSVTGRGATLAEAHERAYRAGELIRFAGKQMRRDIGQRALGAGADSRGEMPLTV